MQNKVCGGLFLLVVTAVEYCLFSRKVKRVFLAVGLVYGKDYSYKYPFRSLNKFYYMIVLYMTNKAFHRDNTDNINIVHCT